MKVTPMELRDVLLIEPDVFKDQRGFFLETWSLQRYADAGVGVPFVQDNLSQSTRGTLRGLHLQCPFSQGKLVHVVRGEVFDVSVDVRVGSPTFGRWVGHLLRSTDHAQIYIPPGFAHGFCVTSEEALFEYKCTETYHPEAELGIAWDDPDLAIAWPDLERTISTKDRAHPRLRDVSEDKLPKYTPPSEGGA